MQIVIDIPECFYEYCKAQEDAIEIQLAVKKGTPLPKEHGRLIDVDKVKYQEGVFLDSEGKPMPIIHKIATIEVIRDWTPAVIEADKADKKEEEWKKF